MTCEWIRHKDKVNVDILAARRIAISLIEWGKNRNKRMGWGSNF